MADRLKKHQRLNANKLLIVSIKFLPITLSLLHFINIVLHLFGVYSVLFDYITVPTLFLVLLLYVTSYVFQFCLYYRIFIHYLLVELCICYLDDAYGIPIENKSMLYLQMCLLFIALLIALFSYMKKNNIKILRK
jgi:hypothetical protein